MALGAILFRAASLWQSLAGNITTTRKFLRQTGTGAVSAAPVWDVLVNGDLPDTAVTPGSYTATNLTVNQKGVITAASNGGTGGTVTHTGTLTAGKTIIGNGGVDITVSALTATVVKSSSGTESAATAGTDYVAPGAVTTSGLTQTTGKLLGRSTAATGAIEEITVSTGLSLSGGNLTATGSSGTVTTTGSPANGNLTKFTGATSISNADLTGDVTTSGTVATTLANTAVTPGSYTNTSLTVDSKGRITAASNGAIGTVNYVIAASDQSVSNNTLVNDAELSFSVSANSVYVLHQTVWVTTGTSTTPDFKFTWTFPVGATISMCQLAMPPGATTSNNTTTYGDVIQSSSGFGPNSAGVLSTATIPTSPIVWNLVLRIGANAGTLQFQWAQATTTGGTPTVRTKDSFIQYTKVS